MKRKEGKKKNDFFKAAFSIFGNIQTSNSSDSHHHHSHHHHHHQSPKSSISSSSTKQSNDFIGQCIILSNLKIKITRVLAEGNLYLYAWNVELLFLFFLIKLGGFAIVYVAEDIIFDTEYALKRIFSADEVSQREIKDEINFLVSWNLNLKLARIQKKFI